MEEQTEKSMREKMGDCIILTPTTDNNVQYVGLNVYAHLINKQVFAGTVQRNITNILI